MILKKAFTQLMPQGNHFLVSSSEIGTHGSDDLSHVSVLLGRILTQLETPAGQSLNLAEARISSSQERQDAPGQAQQGGNATTSHARLSEHDRYERL